MCKKTKAFFLWISATSSLKQHPFPKIKQLPLKCLITWESDILCQNPVHSSGQKHSEGHCYYLYSRGQSDRHTLVAQPSPGRGGGAQNCSVWVGLAPVITYFMWFLKVKVTFPNCCNYSSLTLAHTTLASLLDKKSVHLDSLCPCWRAPALYTGWKPLYCTL